MSNMLQGKRATVFGAGGSIGAAVAREFAAEGAEVFLCGRTQRRNAPLVSIREIEQDLAAGQSMSESLLKAPRRIASGYHGDIFASLVHPP
jgi:NAD(P)-dependent dehydrogenase (short-subunit alcohol dehydrogenase family)